MADVMAGLDPAIHVFDTANAPEPDPLGSDHAPVVRIVTSRETTIRSAGKRYRSYPDSHQVAGRDRTMFGLSLQPFLLGLIAFFFISGFSLLLIRVMI